MLLPGGAALIDLNLKNTIFGESDATLHASCDSIMDHTPMIGIRVIGINYLSLIFFPRFGLHPYQSILTVKELSTLFLAWIDDRFDTSFRLYAPNNAGSVRQNPFGDNERVIVIGNKFYKNALLTKRITHNFICTWISLLQALYL